MLGGGSERQQQITTMMKKCTFLAMKLKLLCILFYITSTQLSVLSFQFHHALHPTSHRKSHRNTWCGEGITSLYNQRTTSGSGNEFVSPSGLHMTSTARENKPEKDDSDSENDEVGDSRALGILVLLTVPLAWGTFTPVVKYVYEIDPPLPGFVFSGGYYIIAAFTLSILSFLQHKFFTASPTAQTDDRKNDEGKEDGQMMLVKNDVLSRNDQLIAAGSSSNQGPVQLLGGLELGSYLFIGNCLQVVGLKTVPADRAAFLVQLTTIMVPLFQAGFAGDLGTIPVLTWSACILAFIGVIIMGLDGPEFEFGIQSIFNSIGDIAFSNGDLLIITAAVSYTMHVIRLGRYAKLTTPLGLAASKAGVEAIFSIGLISLLMITGPSNISFLNDMSSEITTYFQTLNEQIALGQFPPSNFSKVIGAILWTGWITCAYTIYAQSFGQRRVSATDANLIYTMQPLFSALFAFALLGESLGPAGYLGGSLIASALWIVTANKDDTGSQKDEHLDLDGNLE